VVAVVVGVGLLGVAGIFVMAGLRDWRLWTVSGRLPPVTPDQLLAAGGRRRMLVAVTGKAEAGPGGPLTSAVNALPCVWHRHTVRHRATVQLADGRSRQSLRSRLVADETSRDTLLLSGPTARIPLQPQGFRIDRPSVAGARQLPGMASRPFPDAVALMSPDRYDHREWVIHTGTPLYVLAEVVALPDGITLRRPGRGPYVVSTRTLGGVRRRALMSAVTAFAVAAAALAGSVVAFVVLL
jgi:E3 ubiquitin ligase